MAASGVEELQSFFSPGGKPLPPDVLSELQSIMNIYDLSAEDLFFKWDAYCIKLDLDAQTSLNILSIRNLKQTIQDALKKASHSRQQHQVKGERKIAPGPRAGGGGDDMYGMLDGLVPGTPAPGGKLGKGGSALKRKMEVPRDVGSSPVTSGMADQLKAMSGIS